MKLGSAGFTSLVVKHDTFRDLEEFFVLPEPTPNSDPSWFGFPVALRPTTPFTRDQLVRHLDARKIATRLLRFPVQVIDLRQWRRMRLQ